MVAVDVEMSDETETKQVNEEQKSGFAYPPAKRRPDDEFFDLKSIVPLRTERVNDDGSIEIIVVEEGFGNLIEATDTVYYKHEHRFDNGQLTDLNEPRKVENKLAMND